MNFLKEAAYAEKTLHPESDVYLEAQHICIKKNIADKVFDADPVVFTVFYAKENSFMISPSSEESMRVIYKVTQQMLKNKNAAGDKSIAVHEILLDNNIDESDRNLEFTLEETLHILKVKL